LPEKDGPLAQLDLRMTNDAVREAQEAIANVKVWPKIDLFAEYRGGARCGGKLAGSRAWPCGAARS
jgi:hypothetical protein